MINDIRASFRFADGLIADHRDEFDFHCWAGQTLGPAGLLLGWTPLLRGTVRKKARGNLDAYLGAPAARADPPHAAARPRRGTMAALPLHDLGRVTVRRTMLAAAALAALLAVAAAPAAARRASLWDVYDHTLSHARYIDLTHRITPTIPVWAGFSHPLFAPAVEPGTGRAYTYAQDGFEATAYTLPTDQLGTQLDPPAHWAPEYAAIDELPATFAVRQLVVISIAGKVRRNFNYALKVSDIRRFERGHGRIPAGSVVFVRSDWSKRWPDPKLATLTKFPGVSLAALKFLHHRRHILFHGHEPLDTDSTPTLVGEHWLMHHGYAQAEGVANLDKVPATGCLVDIGYPKLGGGLGGYARFVAICPPRSRHGQRIGHVAEAPLRRYSKPLHWDTAKGIRVR